MPPLGRWASACPPSHREHREGDLHPGTRQDAVVNGALHPQVGPAGVPHGGDPLVEIPPQCLRQQKEAVRERRVRRPHLIEVLVPEGDVDVTVEESRQQRPPGHVDPLVCVQTAADVHDASVLDHHVGVARIRPGPVEHPAPLQHDASHRRLLLVDSSRRLSRVGVGCPSLFLIRRKGGTPS
jgi:hypothetical protein